jgi:hypothetical protein
MDMCKNESCGPSDVQAPARNGGSSLNSKAFQKKAPLSVHGLLRHFGCRIVAGGALHRRLRSARPLMTCRLPASRMAFSVAACLGCRDVWSPA